MSVGGEGGWGLKQRKENLNNLDSERTDDVECSNGHIPILQCNIFNLRLLL